MQNIKKISAVLIICFLLLVLVACGVNLKSVKENPQPYIGEILKFNGIITDILNIPFTDFSLYVFEQKGTQVMYFYIRSH